MPGSASERLLDVDSLKTYFRTPAGIVRAVDGVSLHLEHGETLGLVGESGSGKSVLARSVMGLIQPSRSVVREGHVYLNGRDLTQLKLGEIRKLWGGEVGLVLQDPMASLNPVTRVERQLTETIRRHEPVTRAVARERALQLLRDVGIADAQRRLSAYPHELSGGMRQRVLIAIALAANPGLLIADEPTTALDVTIQEQILDMLEDVQADRDMGMIIATHDLGVVASRTHRIMVMYAGRVVESAATSRIFDHVRMPYTKGLIDSLPKLSLPSHSRLTAIKGGPPNLTAELKGCRFAPRCPAAQDICREEEPDLAPAPDDPGHLFRCWYPVGSAEYDAAATRSAAESVRSEVLVP